MKKIIRNTFLAVQIGIVIFVYGIFLYRISKYYFADIQFEKAVDLINAGIYDSALDNINLAIENNPREPNYYRLRAKNLILISSVSESEVAGDFKKEARGDLEKAVSLNPDNLVTIRNCIPLYYYLTVKDLNSSSGSSNVDENYINYTGQFFKSVKERYSRDAGVLILLAKYEQKLGLQTEYEESVMQIKSLRPDLLEWHPTFQ